MQSLLKHTSITRPLLVHLKSSHRFIIQAVRISSPTNESFTAFDTDAAGLDTRIIAGLASPDNAGLGETLDIPA